MKIKAIPQKNSKANLISIKKQKKKLLIAKKLKLRVNIDKFLLLIQTEIIYLLQSRWVENKMSKRYILLNLSLTLFSTLIGINLINIYTFTWINSGLQKSGFPRQSLKYLPALSRWQYPDIYKNFTDKKIIIVGDSYAEGYGDSFLNGDYNYSFAHHLNLLTPYSYALSANGGSFLSRQLFLLDDTLQNKYAPSVKFPSIQALGEKPKFLLTFYEGNDLDDYFRDIQRNGWITGERHHQSFLQRYFPLADVLANIFHYEVKPLIKNINDYSFNNKAKSSNKSYKSSKISYKNNFCFNKLCFKSNYMQAASPELTHKQINQALDYTTTSIRNFKRKYNGNICVVYIPSPATTYYNHKKKHLFFQQYNNGPLAKMGVISYKKNLNKSLYVRDLFKEKLHKENIRMIDSSEMFISKGKLTYLHGTKDNKHFNQTGYRILAEFIAKEIDQCLAINSNHEYYNKS